MHICPKSRLHTKSVQRLKLTYICISLSWVGQVTQLMLTDVKLVHLRISVSKKYCNSLLISAFCFYFLSWVKNVDLSSLLSINLTAAA